MIKQADEKKRALNIIWNASENYFFQPEYKFYDQDSKAELYLNYIIGAVKKYYDYNLLDSYFKYLKTDSDYEFFENLFWIGLENCAYHKVKNERPVISELRKMYARKVLNKETPQFERAILNEINENHYKRVLGEKLEAESRIVQILDELEFSEHIDEKEIIIKMDSIINKYFKFKKGSYEVNYNKLKSADKKTPKKAFEKDNEKKDDEGYSLMKNLVIESSETTRDFYFEQTKKIKDNGYNLHKFNNIKLNADRDYIQKYYGASILPEHKINALEKLLCTENHKRTRLHFTRGEFDHTLINDADSQYVKKLAKEQNEANTNSYYENYARNNNNIVNLTNKIRNTMLVNFESEAVKSDSGNLNANKIWRSFHVNDNKVFTKSLKNDIGNITVDILLDSSASQCERQETIATQGYIIAESLTRCQIPVKVYSYLSLRGYTVINLFRDYDEINKNDKIFNYRASGANRDGLAIKTAVHMMGNSQAENKILIVLSDCKPNDIEINPNTGLMPAKAEYSGIKGVNDTAYEVKRGILKNNKILCVFTGEDEDVISAKRIYGRNFVRINSLDRFADIVGVMLQNQLKNL